MNRAEVLAWLDRTQPAVDRLTPFQLLEIPPTASGVHVQRAFHAIAKTRHPDVWRNHMDAAELERLTHVYGRVAAAYATLRNDESRAKVLRDLRERRPSQPPTPMAAAERDDLGAVAASLARANRLTVATDPPASMGGSSALRAPRPPTMPPPVTSPGATARSAPSTTRPASNTTRPPPSTTAPPPTRRPTTAPPPNTPDAAGNATLGSRALAFYRRAEASLRVGDIAGALLNLRMALAAEPHSVFLKEAIAEAQARFKKK